MSSLGDSPGNGLDSGLLLSAASGSLGAYAARMAAPAYGAAAFVVAIVVTA